MMTINKLRTASIATVVMALTLVASPILAATSPGLGGANSFAILSGTYSNTVSGTTIGGDVGYTTPPAVAPTINGTTHMADSAYTQAGTDQGSALSQLNSQPCTYSFASGAIDLATDATHGTAGVYEPGVYCVSGAVSIGGGGTITLNGAGAHIFRMTGALNTTANSVVVLANGASSCDVWWTPGAATTLGANSTFVGTDIDASGITIGSLVNWVGRALAFGGTVSTASDTITTPTCSSTTSGSGTTTSGSSGSSTDGLAGLPNAGGVESDTNTLLRTLAAALVLVMASTQGHRLLRAPQSK